MKVKELIEKLSKIVSDNPSDADIPVEISWNGTRAHRMDDAYQHVDNVKVAGESPISNRCVMLDGETYDY